MIVACFFSSYGRTVTVLTGWFYFGKHIDGFLSFLVWLLFFEPWAWDLRMILSSCQLPVCHWVCSNLSLDYLLLVACVVQNCCYFSENLWVWTGKFEQHIFHKGQGCGTYEYLCLRVCTWLCAFNILIGSLYTLRVLVQALCYAACRPTNIRAGSRENDVWGFFTLIGVTSWFFLLQLLLFLSSCWLAVLCGYIVCVPSTYIESWKHWLYSAFT